MYYAYELIADGDWLKACLRGQDEDMDAAGKIVPHNRDRAVTNYLMADGTKVHPIPTAVSW